MKAYKGFDKNLQCRGFQYEVGHEYETDRAKLCESGFHACENPLDCMKYYSPNNGSVYHEVDVSGDIERANDDSKVAATKIKIGARLSIAGIVKAAIDFIFNKSKPTAGDSSNAATAGDSSNAATAGWFSNAATAGRFSNAATAGDSSNAATAGDSSNAATAGRFSNAATAGDSSNAEVRGEESIAAVLGKNCKARGGIGCWLVLTERDDAWHILGVRAVRVDGEEYKADTWYTLKDGEVVETKED